MEYRLNLPVGREEIERIKAGDIIYVNGIVVTARDEAHERALEYFREGKSLPVDFSRVAVYHCGPVMKKNEEWHVIAAGPTTSRRMELFEYDFIKNFGTRIIVGKGGMGEKTAKACREYGAIYAAFTGGAAVLAANAIKKVKGVEWLDLGMPEALWIFEVENFGPLVVTIDAHGNNLTEEIKNKAMEKASSIF
ncbi:MAG: fumarate hydratase [Thermoplasmata archaeon]|jgi:tartrate/fumarate subfamily iron-sulfur-dependent hydro-lyase beta chain|nr:MAG: fumarate hydratase [Thermoplasmata archaeon]MCD6222425.1 fumarate hydratase C-terminal domain-containing protein [Thermoplasmata archaeon]